MGCNNPRLEWKGVCRLSCYRKVLAEDDSILYCSLRYSEELLRARERGQTGAGADNFVAHVGQGGLASASIFFYKARTLVYFNLHTLFALHFLL